MYFRIASARHSYRISAAGANNSTIEIMWYERLARATHTDVVFQFAAVRWSRVREGVAIHPNVELNTEHQSNTNRANKEFSGIHVDIVFEIVRITHCVRERRMTKNLPFNGC